MRSLERHLKVQLDSVEQGLAETFGPSEGYESLKMAYGPRPEERSGRDRPKKIQKKLSLGGPRAAELGPHPPQEVQREVPATGRLRVEESTTKSQGMAAKRHVWAKEFNGLQWNSKDFNGIQRTSYFLSLRNGTSQLYRNIRCCTSCGC